MSRENWTPIRYVTAAVNCDFCGVLIPRCKPGTTKGTRGTKAWRSNVRGVWECLCCRSEGFRAESERDKIDDANRAKQESFELGDMPGVAAVQTTEGSNG